MKSAVNNYSESLNALSKVENIDILMCNAHKLICIDNKTKLYKLMCYIHNKEKGYCIDTTKPVEVYNDYKEFRKDYLSKLEVA